jgi:hypothetical protein
MEAFTSSQMYWASAAVTAALDAILIGVLIRAIPPALFGQLLKPLMVTAALFWGGLYSAAAYGFWDICYQFIFPVWVRWAAPFYGLSLGGLAALFWWLSRRTRAHPVAVFTGLAGLHSQPGHLLGIYGREMLTKCPVLLGVSPASALVFGISEFIFYWGVVLGLSAVWQRWALKRQTAV